MGKGVNNGQKAELFVKSSSAPGERERCDAIKHINEQGKITAQLRGSGLRPEAHRSLVENILAGAGKLLKKCLRMLINSFIIPGDLINYHRWRDTDKR